MASPKNSSLWLVPPTDSSLNQTISRLIDETLPPLFPEALPPQFVPHLTLTAGTITTPFNPQEWLDGIQLPDLNRLKVAIGKLHVGDIFFQKLIQLCDRTPQLCELATACRAAGTGASIDETKKFIEQNYMPHVSLVYSDLSQDEMTSKLDRIKEAIAQAKVDAGDTCLSAKGGEIWLVPTFKDVGDWTPTARRQVDVEWKWDT